VAVFVAPSVDSLAAVSILTVSQGEEKKGKGRANLFLAQAMLRRDSIKYILVPVSGYEALAAKAEQMMQESPDLKSFIMVNCGAVVDVASFLQLEENQTAYVVDYHRPVHQRNIHNAKNVVVFADTQEVPNPRPERFEELGPTRQREPRGHDDEGDRNSGGGDDDEATSRKRQRRGEEGDEELRRLADDGEGGGNQEDTLSVFAEELASGSFYGSSGAMLMYELAAQEAAETPHVLWLAILGLTEHYLQHRCTAKQYVKQLDTLRQAAATSNDRSLRFEQYEYHFVLHRHWSLYESMLHSPAVACRLAIWSESGRRRLDQLFAKMGFALQQCKQKFSVMSNTIKERLPEALETYAADFGLIDVTFPSFVKMLDNKLQLSAADCVHVVAALLEAGGGRPDGGGAPVDPAAAGDESVRNFWRAFDALGVRVKWDLVAQGLGVAVGLQQAVVREGVDMLLKKIIVRYGPFRYAVLHDSANLDVFSHPLILTRLALFLLESLKRPGKPSKPLVVCALNRTRGTYLILGVTAAAPSTRAKRNDFGVSFLQAAKITGATICFHSFDSSVIEVPDRDHTRFIELLHSGLLEDN
jgi:cell division control protein 45